MIGEHRHIRITKNAVATVGMNCSPETLKMLKKMADIVETRMNNATKKMQSRKILPVKERLNNGEYTRKFNSGRNFKHLHDLTKKYHIALLEAEEDLFLKSIGCNSETIFPKKDRLPFDGDNEYIGISKFVFYHFKSSIKKYHKALTNAEYHILNYSLTNKIKENHGKK